MNNKLQKIENQENNIRLELISGTIALVVSLIFVFSNHLSTYIQIFYVIFLYFFHLFSQLIIFAFNNFDTKFNREKIMVRVVIIILVLVYSFQFVGSFDLLDLDHFGFATESRKNIFLSAAIYSGMYFLIYSLGLAIINKNRRDKHLPPNEKLKQRSQ